MVSFTDAAVAEPSALTFLASHARARARVVAEPTLLIVAEGQRRLCSFARRSGSAVTPTYTVREPNLTTYLYVSFLLAMSSASVVSLPHLSSVPRRAARGIPKGCPGTIIQRVRRVAQNRKPGKKSIIAVSQGLASWTHPKNPTWT